MRKLTVLFSWPIMKNRVQDWSLYPVFVQVSH